MKTFEMENSHPWEARFIVGLLILILGFIGLVVTDIKEDGGWNYWRTMVFVNAALCLWLSWYIRHKKGLFKISFFWKEVAHWIGLLLAVYLISVFVNMGIMGRFIASLQVLTLLSLTTFLAGLYTEPFLMVVGVVLGIFCAGVAFVDEYLYSIMLPVTLGAAFLLFWVVRRKRRRVAIHEE